MAPSLGLARNVAAQSAATLRVCTRLAPHFPRAPNDVLKRLESRARAGSEGAGGRGCWRLAQRQARQMRASRHADRDRSPRSEREERTATTPPRPHRSAAGAARATKTEPLLNAMRLLALELNAADDRPLLCMKLLPEGHCRKLRLILHDPCGCAFPSNGDGGGCVRSY